jgi:hypothetical protein
MVVTWILTLILLNEAHAEYRAFELVIANPATGQERVVVSNLDPRRYRHYYPVKAGEEITYRQTWMCRGNTSQFKPVCPKPADSAPPATTEVPTKKS